MPIAPRPEKAEQGKGKGNRQTRRDPAWKKDEREFARWNQDTYGKDDDPVIAPLMTTTGRVGHFPQLGYDLTSKHTIGESKDHKLPKWLVTLWTQAQTESDGVQAEHPLPSWIADAWAQIQQCRATRATRRVAVLFLSYGKDTTPEYRIDGKLRKLPAMHVIDKEHHAELVKAWLGMARIREVLAVAKADGDWTDAISGIETVLKDIA